jgi:hypothetical protein
MWLRLVWLISPSQKIDAQVCDKPQQEARRIHSRQICIITLVLL